MVIISLPSNNAVIRRKINYKTYVLLVENELVLWKVGGCPLFNSRIATRTWGYPPISAQRRQKGVSILKK